MEWDNSEQDRMGWDRVKWDGTVQSRTEWDGKDGMGQDRIG